jgi:hypothetical protein
MIGATEAKRIIDLFGCLECRGGRRIPDSPSGIGTCINKRVSEQKQHSTAQSHSLLRKWELGFYTEEKQKEYAVIQSRSILETCITHCFSEQEAAYAG